MKINKELKYLGKSDFEKSFKKIQKDEIKFIESDDDKCVEIIENLTKNILSKYEGILSVSEGNFEDLTNRYKQAYRVYLKDLEERNDRKYNTYIHYFEKPQTEENYIRLEFGHRFGFTNTRFKKYIPNKKEEQKVLYFELKKEYHARSKYTFSFCAYFDSENRFCFDKISYFQKTKWKDYLEDYATAKTSPDKVMEFLETLILLEEKGKENYEERQKKLEKDKIKRAKVNELTKKAGIINVKKILNEIDCSYEIEEMNNAVKIHILLDKGYTTIKIPKKNLKESLEHLPEFVEAILKAEKLKIYFRHLQN